MTAFVITVAALSFASGIACGALIYNIIAERSRQYVEREIAQINRMLDHGGI